MAFVTFLHQRGFASRAKDERDDVTESLQDCFKCLAHNFNVLNGELLGLFCGRNHLSFTLQRYKKIPRLPNIQKHIFRLFLGSFAK